MLGAHAGSLYRDVVAHTRDLGAAALHKVMDRASDQTLLTQP